jgi:transcriptional regulator with XRE-family HTH domain
MIGFTENNERIPTVDTVVRISCAFGISLSQLIEEAEKKL